MCDGKLIIQDRKLTCDQYIDKRGKLSVTLAHAHAQLLARHATATLGILKFYLTSSYFHSHQFLLSPFLSLSRNTDQYLPGSSPPSLGNNVSSPLPLFRFTFSQPSFFFYFYFSIFFLFFLFLLSCSLGRRQIYSPSRVASFSSQTLVVLTPGNVLTLRGCILFMFSSVVLRQ